MNFFEGLANQMGPSAYNAWLDALSWYLGPYGILMNMTCKGMKTFPFHNNAPQGGRWIRSTCFESAGYAELLKWWYEGENYIDSYSWGGLKLDILKWKLSLGLQETGSIIRKAANQGKRDIVDYWIDNRFCLNLWYSTDNVEMLDYMYRVRKLDMESNMWDNGWYPRSEAIYVWAMQYQHDPNISFYEAMENDPNLWCKMVRWWASHEFQNTQVMIRILYAKDDETLLPAETCKWLTYPVAKAIDSEWCECNDPKNHEERKRIKGC